MKKLVAFLFIAILQSITFTQWFYLYSGNYTSYLYDVKFFDANTGWVVGDNKILKTTNGGVNWINYSPSTSFYLRAGFFINPTTGWAAGSEDVIIKTTNSGVSWSNYSAIPSTNWHQIHFVNELTGYIVGTSGKIIKSTNGGVNWSPTPSGVISYLFAVYFISPDTGWVTGYDGTILKTTNGGNTWIFQVSGLTSGLLQVQFLNYNTGWTVSDNGVILNTTNSGTTWNVNSSWGTTYVFQGLDFINNLSGWVVGGFPYGGVILATTNGGVSWVNQFGGGPSTLIGIDMVNSSTGYIAGFNGTILKTVNGGFISVKKIGEEVPGQFELRQNYPNPFNPSTRIEYSLAEPAHVKLTVYDITGRLMQTLVDELQSYGTYRVEFDGSPFASGTYIYHLESEKFSSKRLMILIK